MTYNLDIIWFYSSNFVEPEQDRLKIHTHRRPLAIRSVFSSPTMSHGHLSEEM